MDLLNSHLGDLINPKLFDHYAVHSQVKIIKPFFQCKEITYRKLKAIDTESLRNDIKFSTLLSDYTGLDLVPLIEKFQNMLTNFLGMHTPIKKRTIILRPHAPRYNDSIDVEKKKCDDGTTSRALALTGSYILFNVAWSMILEMRNPTTILL